MEQNKPESESMSIPMYEDLLKVLGCLSWRIKDFDCFLQILAELSRKRCFNFSIPLQRRELGFTDEVVMLETLTYCEE